MLIDHIENWTKTLVCTSPGIFTDYDFFQTAGTNILPVMMVNGLWKGFSIIKEKHSFFYYVTFQGKNTEKQSLPFGRVALCPYFRLKEPKIEGKESHHCNSSSSVLLKPAPISIGSFYKSLANQAKHAPSSWESPAEDDPKPRAVRWLRISEEKEGIVSSFGHW